jgi:hypothetical protein
LFGTDKRLPKNNQINAKKKQKIYERSCEVMYNIILYIGLFLIVGGFSLFLYSEMRLKQLDREAFMNQQLTKSFNKAKEEEAK